MTPAHERYDAVVIGAGPAGAIVARELARQRQAVLLVDKATFPRRKVCGCCLNGNALAALAAVGLGELPEQLGAVPLSSLQLAANGLSATVSLDGQSLSREAFDVALIQNAVAAGVEFHQGCKAAMGPVAGPGRVVSVNDTTVSAGVVVVADGLNGRTAATAEAFGIHAKAESRIGAGVVVPSQREYAPGTIFMAAADGGYVGLVVLENGRLDLAAAFDSALVRRVGGLGPAAVAILADAGLPAIPDLELAEWKGTPALTRTPTRIAGERWFAVGDACGYIEPFTGEGMAWAISGAASLANLLVHGWHSKLPQRWAAVHRRVVRRRQWQCRLIAFALRKRAIRGMMVAVLRRLPVLAVPFVRGLNRPPTLTANGVG